MMDRVVNVVLLPGLIEPAELAGGVAVVIDVLRATTTLVEGLANGARSVVPCESVEAARAVRDERGADVLLGGERNCQLIPGFDLDNSPASWGAGRVAGRDIAFTTTNGTRALLRAVQADRIYTAALVNRSAVLRQLAGETRPVHIVCAGTEGTVSLEDSLCAGALVAGLWGEGGREKKESTGGASGTREEGKEEVLAEPAAHGEVTLNDSARLALALWEAHGATLESRVAAMRAGRGGHNLRRLGMETDIVTAARLDQVDLVPEYLPQSRAIRPAAG